MIAGAQQVIVGFALMSRITTIWHYYLLLGTFMAAGMGMMGGLASSKLVANWFVARRGTALGIATMGVSLSGLVMPLVATWLVANLGWRGGFEIYALGTITVVVPLVAWFVVSRPEDIGLRPDGGSPTSDPSDPTREIEVVWRTRDILRSRNLWVIAIPFAMTFSALSAILLHLVPYADDVGIPPYRTAWVLSVAAGTGALGKLAFGWLVDRLDARIAVWISFAAQMIGLMMIMQGGSYGDLLAGAMVFGFGMGGVIPLQGAVTGAAFGRLSFGKVLGLMRPVQLPLHALGIPLAGWIHDSTGSYDLAWRIFLGVYVAASLVIFGLRPQPASRSAASASAGETGLS
jgi:MFS family permease